jgi:predicted ABC-type ATPase
VRSTSPRFAQRAILDARPIIVAIAGPNGAGKTTFYHAHLEPAGLRFLNADVMARELALDPYAAARVAQELRDALAAARESFVFETVFWDPAGDKLAFLQRAAAAGYAVVMCFIGIAGPDVSETRVAMRVSQGGHDVPSGKIASRYPRTMANLGRAIATLPHVFVFDNDDLAHPFRLVAECAAGRAVRMARPVPAWLDVSDCEQDRPG